MDSGQRAGEGCAALNFALARKSAALPEAVKSVWALALPVKSCRVDLSTCFGTERRQSHPLAAGPIASTSIASASARPLLLTSRIQRVRGFFHGFFSPPQCSQLLHSRSGWQLRVVAKLAGAVALRRSEWDLDAAVVQLPVGPRLDESQVRMMFDEMDVNGDGVIDRDELLHWLSAVGLPASNSCYLGDVMEQYADDSGAAALSFTDFHRYVSRATSPLVRAFRALDPSGTGYLTDAGLLTALRSMGFSAQKDDAQKMIELLDRNHDRRVTFAEFVRFACLLPETQVANDNVAFCWVDSADFVDGLESRLHMTPSKQTTQRLVSGGIAGVLSRSMVAPLERLRTIMMASPTALSMRGAVDLMWRDGGLGGLFKGNMATAIKVLPSSAVQFAVYDGACDALRALRPPGARDKTFLLDRLVAGVIAGAASCIATYPLETIRTRMCVPGGAGGTFSQAATQALRSHGLLGLYSGFGSSLLGEMIGTGLGFCAYELGNQWWERTHGVKPSAAQKGVIGAASALVVMTATMPLELIQRRMQVAGTSAGAAFQYRGTADAFAQICRKEGFGAFYRGSLFAYGKVVPSIGAMYMLYELGNQALAIGGLRRYTQDKAALQERQEQRRLQKAASPSGPPRKPFRSHDVPLHALAAREPPCSQSALSDASPARKRHDEPANATAPRPVHTVG